MQGLDAKLRESSGLEPLGQGYVCGGGREHRQMELGRGAELR